MLHIIYKKTADFFTAPQKQLIFPFLILEQLIFNAEEQLIVFLVSQLVTECQFDGIAKYWTVEAVHSVQLAARQEGGQPSETNGHIIIIAPDFL